MGPKKLLALGLLALVVATAGYALATTLLSTQNGAKVHVNTTSNLVLQDTLGNTMTMLDFGNIDAGATATISGNLVYNSNAASPNGYLQVRTQSLPVGLTFASPQDGAPITPGTLSISFTLTIGSGVAEGDYAWDVFLSISDIPPSTVFSFAAAGDLGSATDFTRTLAKLGSSNASFFIALGDLSYTSQEQQWCNTFKAKFNNIELIVGNHDEGGGGGDISKYIRYCPFTLSGLVGGSDPDHTYGYEYYFDYPAQSPLARFIQIAPDITFKLPGLMENWNYTLGNPHYKFVRDAIDSARSSGVTWVVVTMHKDYISAGGHGNDIGSDLFNLFISKRVDLVLQAHSHNYQRSKQVAHSPNCLVVNVAFNSACVVNDGSSGLYDRGKGSVWQIVGTFGRSLASIGTNLDWFAKANDKTHGFMQFAVGPTRIAGQFVGSDGSFTDNFSILGLSPSFLSTSLPGNATVGPAQQPASVRNLTTIFQIASTELRTGPQRIPDPENPSTQTVSQPPSLTVSRSNLPTHAQDIHLSPSHLFSVRPNSLFPHLSQLAQSRRVQR